MTHRHLFAAALAAVALAGCGGGGGSSPAPAPTPIPTPPPPPPPPPDPNVIQASEVTEAGTVTIAGHALDAAMRLAHAAIMVERFQMDAQARLVQGQTLILCTHCARGTWLQSFSRLLKFDQCNHFS
jgi:hypothetical protein